MPAQSKTQNFFVSPSGNIGCELDHQVVHGTGDRAYCQTFSPARSVTLSSDGRIKMCTGHSCIGNGPENAYTLPYGSSTELGPFRCVSRPTGMTCTAAAATGFEISRAGVRKLGG